MDRGRCGKNSECWRGCFAWQRRHYVVVVNIKRDFLIYGCQLMNGGGIHIVPVNGKRNVVSIKELIGHLYKDPLAFLQTLRLGANTMKGTPWRRGLGDGCFYMAFRFRQRLWRVVWLFCNCS